MLGCSTIDFSITKFTQHRRAVDQKSSPKTDQKWSHVGQNFGSLWEAKLGPSGGIKSELRIVSDCIHETMQKHRLLGAQKIEKRVPPNPRHHWPRSRGGGWGRAQILRRGKEELLEDKGVRVVGR